MLAGIVLGAAIFAVGVFALLLLFCDNSVTISVRNDSVVPLGKVTVVVPNSWSDSTPHLKPGDEIDFETFDTFGPRIKLQFRVIFDGNGNHYDVPVQARLAPFGSYYVPVSIDQHMQVSFQATPM